jgi:multimeric flavodoxin WrbA/nitrite reductase/ring-hydroxylating ferredoxin subunit
MGERQDESWIDLGPVEALKEPPVREVMAGKLRIALTYHDGKFGAVSGICNHVGGPLGKGTLDGEYLVCPWHHYKFHRVTGEGEPGYEADRVPQFALKIEQSHLFVNPKAVLGRSKLPHDPHPLARKPTRADGPTRVVGISTTAMDEQYPRYSTSDTLLDVALAAAREKVGAETRLIRLNALKFRHCEGYYSKSLRACTWPCSITQMDDKDQMEQVYEALVHWADVALIATPIRWGAASSLYYKMVERMNCIQNQITLRNEVLIRNKVAAFIIMGGQDNVQAVAGQMLAFFAEIGFVFPPFPYIAHTFGWNFEDMERNWQYVQKSEALKEGARQLAERAVRAVRDLVERDVCAEHISRGGRKAHNPAAAEEKVGGQVPGAKALTDATSSSSA